ncbi:MAG: wax ester/triacylglycerol synthase family O-acyltransferase [Solirubrobacterales bacterium]|nr:wax ester/triacylglycerol synthase family O-acyltransferase [Solirubrobacterales bacterium]
MAQQHGDRLTAVDASFLAQEGPDAHMHVGAVMIFEGPPPTYPDFVNQIRGRLHLVPRYRQKLAVPPLETGRPLWVDDTSFNLEFHVRHTALPKPGSELQLRALAARIHSQRLDRTKPLWEFWLVQGLESNRFALISKAHHALVDGVAGVDLVTVLFDLTPVPAPTLSEGEPWVPCREPSPIDLAARGIKGLIRTPLHLATRATVAATRPSQTLGATREAVEGIGEVAWAALNPAPETPLNVPIGPHRRLVVVRNELTDFRRVKDAFGTTVNDVVLAVVAGALRRWLQSRGVRTEGLELRALVPVSIRTDEQHGQMGNRIAAMRGPLPVYVDDPVARLRVVKQAMDGLKHSKQAVGAEVLAAAQRFAPPTVLAQASRLNFSTRLFNLLVTNVPGPQFPLYVLGRELEDLFPVAFLPRDHALAVAIMSYNGGMDFGLLGDYDAMPDLDFVGEAVQASLAELVDASRRRESDSASRGQAPRRRPRAGSSGGREARVPGAGV